MKKLLFPLALFSMFFITSCGDDTLETECNQVSKDDLPDDTPTCKLSENISDIGYCTDEASEDVHFTYKGSGSYDDKELVKVVCPMATNADRDNIVEGLSETSRKIIARVRVKTSLY